MKKLASFVKTKTRTYQVVSAKTWTLMGQYYSADEMLAIAPNYLIRVGSTFVKAARYSKTAVLEVNV